MKTYNLELGRSTYETVNIVVAASDEDEARAKALNMADGLDWEYDSGRDSVITCEPVKEDEEDEEEEEED